MTLASIQVKPGGRQQQSTRPLMEPGDRLDQKTFHRLYEQMPPGTRAELIEGTVYMPPALRAWHGRPHAILMGWLAQYDAATPGCPSLDNTTSILSSDSEPQPDAMLTLENGQTAVDEEGWLIGPPEFVAEVATSSVSYDLHQKKNMYEKRGVLEYLVLLVFDNRAIWFVRSGDRFVEMAPDADQIHRSRVFPGLWLDSAALFRSDAAKVVEVLNHGLQSPEHAAFVASLKPKS